jgi:phosphopantetheinyl transferase
MRSRQFNKQLKRISEDSMKGRWLSKSYSGDVMVLAISDNHKVSVDVEEMRYRSAEAITHYLNKFITFKIGSTIIGASQEQFYKIWTAMESFFKLGGQGFHSEKDFELDIENERIVKSGETLGWIRYLSYSNHMICLCSAEKIYQDQLATKYLKEGGEPWQNMQ